MCFYGAELTITVNPVVPAAVGVPEITPEVESVNPAGRVPELIVHVYGVIPPVAVRVALYGVPTTTDGSDVVVMASGGGATTLMANAFDALWVGDPESETLTVTP